jgi:hypothetical protein
MSFVCDDSSLSCPMLRVQESVLCVLCVACVRVCLMVMMYYITRALYWLLSPSLLLCAEIPHSLTPREHLAELQDY